jgi:hypothetical protein
MRNCETINAILPNGNLANDLSALLRLHPDGYNLPLTSDKDMSFWAVVKEPHRQVTAVEEPAECTPPAESPSSEELEENDNFLVKLPGDPA